MIDWSGLSRALTFGIASGLAPGATNALILAQSVRYGLREGLKVAVAPLLTDAPIIALSLWLVHRWQGSARWVGVVAWVGAAILVLLAVECLRARLPDASDTPQAAGSLWKGALANGLNPHPYLFWLTIGAPSLLETWERGWAQAVLFLLLFYGGIVGSKALIALAAARGRGWIQGQGYRWVLRLLGLLLLGFALQFAWTGWRQWTTG